jgi:hypothetical protein
MYNNPRVDPVSKTEFLADEAEQIAHHLHRMLEALKAIAKDFRGFYCEVVAPIVEWLRSMRDSQAATA